MEGIFSKFVIYILLISIPALKSQLNQTVSEEVDYDEEIVMPTEPQNGFQRPIQYATSPEEEEQMKKKMFGKVQGRLALGDFFQDNTEKGKKERQKLTRFLYKTEDNKWIAADLKTLGEVKNWNKTGKLKVMVHGFTSQIQKPPRELIKQQNMFKLGDAYIEAQKGDVNILVVDWTALSREPLYKYYEAAASTKNAGEATADFLIQLVKRQLISSYKDIHLLGHSLGSHVAGAAGYYVFKKSKSKVGRITGLDPAGPMFEDKGKLPSDKSKALDKSDAEFVDILHCNTGNVVTTMGQALGTTVGAGTADFYPNGGKRQKRCTVYQDQMYGCSHQLSVKYYIEALKKPKLACPCASWKKFLTGACKCTAKTGGMYMGDACLESARGKYFLEVE